MRRMTKFRRRLHGLGDAPTGTQLTPYGVDANNYPVYIDPNTGDVYDMDGNLLTDLSKITTVEALQNAGVLPIYAGVQPAPSVPPSQPPRGSSSFTAWLSQPVAAGWPSNGTVIGFAALGTAAISLLGRKGRR